MHFGDIRGHLEKMIALLKEISSYTKRSPCCVATVSSGINSSIPAGFTSISITQTSNSGTITNITFADGTVYPLSTQGETYTVVAPVGKYLPAYTIATADGATWKWTGIK